MEGHVAALRLHQREKTENREGGGCENPPAHHLFPSLVRISYAVKEAGVAFRNMMWKLAVYRGRECGNGYAEGGLALNTKTQKKIAGISARRKEKQCQRQS
jgi:hypothetical protein